MKSETAVPQHSATEQATSSTSTSTQLTSNKKACIPVSTPQQIEELDAPPERFVQSTATSTYSSTYEPGAYSKQCVPGTSYCCTYARSYLTATNRNALYVFLCATGMLARYILARRGPLTTWRHTARLDKVGRWFKAAWITLSPQHAPTSSGFEAIEAGVLSPPSVVIKRDM